MVRRKFALSVRLKKSVSSGLFSIGYHLTLPVPQHKIFMVENTLGRISIRSNINRLCPDEDI
jgi:hypothetical protein